MHPLVRTAVVAAVLTALGSFERDEDDTSRADRGPELPVLCSAHAIPDGSACVPIPSAVASASARPVEPDKDPWIPRRPDRASDYAAYTYPAAMKSVVPATGGVALELVTTRGAPVTVVTLENQQGDAEVLFVGDLFATTVATKHVVREAGRDRIYVVVLGYLGKLEPAVTVGAHLAAGAVVGVVGAGPSGRAAQLHLETRRAQESASLAKLDAAHLTDPAISVPIDPRNVLAPHP